MPRTVAEGMIDATPVFGLRDDARLPGLDMP